MSNYVKGQRNQNKCRKYFESLGYEVEVVRYDKWKKSKDFFSLWDLICVSSNNIVFVQVKTNRKPPKEWVDRAEVWGPPRICKICAIYEDYVGGIKPAKILNYGLSYFTPIEDKCQTQSDTAK